MKVEFFRLYSHLIRRLKDGKEIELIARIRVQMQTIEGFTTR